MRLIVGLGNPGHRYNGTRHNLGYMVVDRFARSLRASFVGGKGEFLVAEADLDDIPVAIIKPTTFMNDSGLAVDRAVGLYQAGYEDALIVYDDFQLPLGTIRVRARGTDGGHNGMASVLYHAGTDAIPRLRCGIGREDIEDAGGSAIGFVLGTFDPDEELKVEPMIVKASEGIALCVREGIDAAMNILNRYPEQNG